MLQLSMEQSQRKTCLVLGGLGFIGSHLVDSLLAQGFRVRVLDRPRIKAKDDSRFSSPYCELLEGDFTNETDIVEAIQGCDYCFHLVSTTLPKSSNANPVFDVESNVVGTIHLLQHAVANGLKKVIFVSSGGTVYGTPLTAPIHESHPTNPVCSYGITKLMIEKYLSLFYSLHGLDYTVLRLANPYGEGQRTHSTQGAVAVFLGKALRGETVEIWGDGAVIRDYIHISDVVEALLLSIPPTKQQHVFNIGSGRGHSLKEALSTIEMVTKRDVARHYQEARAFDVPANILDISAAREILGWQPKVEFDEGVERFSKWIQAHDFA